MSDVSKTKELLARADQDIDLWGDGYGRNGIVRELRDALEAKTGIRVDMSSAVGVEAQLAVQGEPNVDREARERVSRFCQEWRKLRSNDHESIYNLHLGTEREVELRTADLERLSRATVPDAATEELAQAKSDMKTVTEIFRNVFDNTRAERAAALAAIGRVRAMHLPVALETKTVCEACGDEWPCSTVEALDGAPEPEEAELPETGLEVRNGDGDLIMSGEHRKVLHQGMYVCDSCVNALGLNVRWDRAGFMEGHPLPVEGEKP